MKALGSNPRWRAMQKIPTYQRGDFSLCAVSCTKKKPVDHTGFLLVSYDSDVVEVAGAICNVAVPLILLRTFTAIVYSPGSRGISVDPVPLMIRV